MNKIVLIFCLIFSLYGCSLESTGYKFPTSMAIEYKEGDFVVSIVIPSLEETSNSSEDSNNSISIVRSKGKTISEAIGRIELKEKGMISATQIKSVIFHKSLFKEGNVKFSTLCDYFIETTELRLDTFVYTTDEKIDDLLSLDDPLSKIAFNTLNSATIMDFYNLYKTDKFINLMVNFYENRSIYIPSLVINEEVLAVKEKEELKDAEIYYIDEMCFLSSYNENLRCIKKEELKGLTYFQEKKQFNLEYGKENSIVSVIVKNVKTSMSYKKDKANMKVKVTLEIIDNMKNDSIGTIKESFSKIIKSKIVDTYEVGRDNGIDVYHIKDGYKRYKKRNIELTNELLEVNVSIKILGQNVKK